MTWMIWGHFFLGHLQFPRNPHSVGYAIQAFRLRTAGSEACQTILAGYELNSARFTADGWKARGISHIAKWIVFTIWLVV